MKKTVTLSFLLLLFTAMLSVAFKGETAKNENTTSPIVIELFTSQGCSSCPPADKLLLETIREAEKKGNPVYALSFHVDYWNRLGWTDPYSKPQFSDRQREYANHFAAGKVYTPQIIVNGSREFVGSDASTLDNAIQEAETMQGTVQLKEIAYSQNKLTGKFLVSDNIDDGVLNMAIVETGLTDDVKAGENKGKTLLHGNVVRIFQQFELSEEEFTLSVPDKVILSDAKLIAYVQARDTWKILAANASSIPTE